MRKLGKRILSLLIVAMLVCTMLPVTASAATNYGNGSFTEAQGQMYIINPRGENELTYGWKVSVTNPRQSFTLWFPAPTEYGSTFSGHYRFTAGEHGTGSYNEKHTITYIDYNNNTQGYELYIMPTFAEVEKNGITPDKGYKFSHYEITYWNRNSSSAAFTKRTERFDPSDIMPFDVNLRGKYAMTQGYLDIKVIFVEDENTPVDYTLTYDANGGVNAPAAETITSTTGSATFTVTDAQPTRTGYTFKGWADTADATTAGYLAGDGITLAKAAPSKTIYAVWEKDADPEYTYTLNYNANEGTGAPEAQTATSTEATYDFTVSDVAPTREGYKFLGWADTADATAAVYMAGAVIHMTKENNEKTIYAVWEKNAEPGPGEKVSKPGITKTEDKTTLNGNEVVNYTLTSNVPDYLGDYLELPTPSEPVIVNATGEVVRGTYPLTFYDKLPEGLNFNNDVTVKIGTRVLPTTAYTLTKGAATDDFTFRVDLDLVTLYEKGLLTMADIKNAEDIIVTYSATLAKDAKPGHYVNDAWVGFEGGFSEKAHANLNTYGIEVFKYDQSNSKAPLQGATFKLKDAAGNVVGEATTEKDGTVRFNALAAGTYTLEEFTAPDGYVKSEKTLSITLPDNVKEDLVAYAEFANAPIPHTGGEGTSTIFILGGSLMGVAVALYMASQKKRSFQA